MPNRATSNERPALDAEAAAALGVAGWALAAEMMARLRDAGLISEADGEAIIKRALSNVKALGMHLQGPALEGALAGLQSYSLPRPRRPPSPKKP